MGLSTSQQALIVTYWCPYIKGKIQIMLNFVHIIELRIVKRKWYAGLGIRYYHNSPVSRCEVNWTLSQNVISFIHLIITDKWLPFGDSSWKQQRLFPLHKIPSTMHTMTSLCHSHVTIIWWLNYKVTMAAPLGRVTKWLYNEIACIVMSHQMISKWWLYGNLRFRTLLWNTHGRC